MTASGQASDSIEALFDFAEYENSTTYQSPSLSPSGSGKNAFVRPISQAPTPIMPAATQPLSGPSHQYELYKQQTGIVPGALASTLAINQNSQVANYSGMGLDYLGLSPQDGLFDFNTPPSQGSFGASDLDMDFDPVTTEQMFYENNTVNPNALGDQSSSSMASSQSLHPTTSNVGRLWPGMHSQAAAKAQAQRQQQQQQQQQHQLQQRQMNQPKPRSKSSQPADPIVEQKITQLLNSMRAKPSSSETQQNMPLLNVPKPRKDEDDMDEDEKLLASEEGKKLTSKERRQLRNKVSARAFRSRRKEYITQLEAEIATRVSENADLRLRNHSLEEENKRLGDLTRMLLSSPSFSDFLDRMSTNPAPQPSPQVQSQPVEQERRQVPKDVNPYGANQHMDHQRIGMAMIPETPMDMSMLTMDHDTTFNFQPQVFAVLETPDIPSSIDTTVLSGKKSNFVGEQMTSDDDKLEMPAIDRSITEKSLAPPAPQSPPLDPEFESNPDFALFHSSPEDIQTEAAAEDTWQIDIFGGLEPEKVLARYELIDASEAEQSAVLTVARVQRICDRLESTWERINELTWDL